jgi:hypothetical protein
MIGAPLREGLVASSAVSSTDRAWLADWRRQVAALYVDVRVLAATDPIAAWDHWRARRIINREREKEFLLDRDLLLHQDCFDRELPHFHCQHAFRLSAHVIRFFGEGHSTDSGASGGPGLDLDHHGAGKRCGDLRITLVSPAGTRSVLPLL